MGKQIFQITGMTQDVSPSKFPIDRAFSIKNMRITAQEDTQLLSLTSEKGNSILPLLIHDNNYEVTSIYGEVVGYCTINEYLVLFTHQQSSNYDYIYRFEYNPDKTSLIGYILYKGDLGFSSINLDNGTYNRIETQVYYENENIIKVYWIDGNNQPRFINIADFKTLEELIDKREKLELKQSPFDYLPILKYQEKVKIERNNLIGNFPAGTIQYFLTYFDVFGTQSKPFYVSPIYYTSPENRGGTVEERTANSFTITIINSDQTFDYIRAYSVMRTSEDGTPICKCIGDYKNKYLFKPATLTKDLGQSIASGVSFNVYFPSLRLFNMEGNVGTEIDLNFYGRTDNDGNYYYEIPCPVRDEEGVYTFIAKDTEASDVLYEFLPLFSITSARHSIIITVNKSTNIATITQEYDFASPSIQKRSHEELIITESEGNKIENITIIDTNTSGYSVDYAEIMYAGGSYFVPQTMEQINNVMFYGNYKYNDSSFNEEFLNIIKEHSAISYYYKDPIKKGKIGGIYQYYNQLQYNMDEISSFKGGDTYTFGLIFQNKYGEWSSVVPLEPAKNNLYPKDSPNNYSPIGCHITLDATAVETIKTNYPDFVRMKAVVLNNINHSVICQGVLCPTMFNQSRKSNNPYAQASWFFRPSNDGNKLIQRDTHYMSIPSLSPDNRQVEGINGMLQTNSEIYGASNITRSATHYPQTPLDFFVDKNIITLNSPDIDYDRVVLPTSKNIGLRIIGVLPITSTSVNQTITLSSLSRSATEKKYENNNNTYSPLTVFGNSPLGSYQTLTSLCWTDWWKVEEDNVIRDEWTNFPVYPWHRSGSIAADYIDQNGEEHVYGELKQKKLASLRSSSFSVFLDNPFSYTINNIGTYRDDSTPIIFGINDNDPVYNGTKVYYGEYNAAIIPASGYKMPYITNNRLENPSAWSQQIAYAKNIATMKEIVSFAPVSIKYKSTPHIIMQLPIDTFGIQLLPKFGSKGEEDTNKNYNQVFWKKQSSSNTYYSFFTYEFPNIEIGVDNVEYLPFDRTIGGTVYSIPQLIIPKTVFDNLLGTSHNFSYYKDRFYFPDVQFTYDGISRNCIWYCLQLRTDSSYVFRPYPFLLPFSSKIPNEQVDSQDKEYQSYPFKKWYLPGELKILELESAIPETYSNYGCEYWFYIDNILDPPGNSLVCKQDQIGNIAGINNYYVLYLGELYQEDNAPADYKNLDWISAGQPSFISTSLHATTGDTYYQRYDCLKTYPYTLEDTNQIIEIFSFMCETRINIDGRTDIFRGLIDNTIVTNTNFNLLNKCYTQKDNFYNYSFLNESFYNINSYNNSILWSLPKNISGLIDNWTNITPTSTISINGDKGSVNALKKFNNRLLCFQDNGIAQLNYNERVAIPSSDNVPIELANSSKVDGYTYLSDNIGCKNKYSIKVTPTQLYFADSNTRDLYSLGNGISVISKLLGMNTFMYNTFDMATMHTDYDEILRSVYFINDDYCFMYDEQSSNFISFYDYNKSEIFNLDNTLVSLHKDNNLFTVWKQFSGNYNSFYGTKKPFGIEIIANDSNNPIGDKIFTNIEYRSDTYNNTDELLHTTSFDTIAATTEYQSTGNTLLEYGKNIKKRFRIWRAELPREEKMRRIRNPWAKIRLVKQNDLQDIGKTVLHDIIVSYI